MIEDKEAYTVFLKIRAERGRGKAYGGGLVVGCCGGRPWQCRAHGEVPRDRMAAALQWTLQNKLDEKVLTEQFSEE